MTFSRLQWLIWSAGLLASTILLFALGMGKGGPGWYPPLFVAAAAYCLVAQVVVPLVRRRAGDVAAQTWASALATSRLGLLVLLALALVAGAFVLFRIGR